MAAHGLLPCQMYDPAKGPFDPTPRSDDTVFRPGKTREDRMPVARRPRVEEAQKRAQAMKARAA